MRNIFFFGILIVFIFLSLFSFISINDNDKILSYTINLKKQNLSFYWKDDHQNNFLNFANLKKWLSEKGEKLVFATNGGMYLQDKSPQGLFIQNGIEYKKLDTLKKGYGNFYMQPNGIFYITNTNRAIVSTSIDIPYKDIRYATQSGPMLVIDNQIHSKFREGSKNLNIRNGVGILPNGNILFAMSKQKINLFDFANYFKIQGFENALYLDGYVSKTYLPSKNWFSLDGNFGVIIAETIKN